MFSAWAECDRETQGRVMEASKCGDKASGIGLLLDVQQTRGRKEWRAPREHASQLAYSRLFYG